MRSHNFGQFWTPLFPNPHVFYCWGFSRVVTKSLIPNEIVTSFIDDHVVNCMLLSSSNSKPKWFITLYYDMCLSKMFLQSFSILIVWSHQIVCYKCILGQYLTSTLNQGNDAKQKYCRLTSLNIRTHSNFNTETLKLKFARA